MAIEIETLRPNNVLRLEGLVHKDDTRRPQVVHDIMTRVIEIGEKEVVCMVGGMPVYVDKDMIRTHAVLVRIGR